ncbi:MAG TPA: hypothetical protein VMI54_22655 [Polyangiaceae bacterium]|nr:hypothetical protein [Polyangiaceae bacterium]
MRTTPKAFWFAAFLPLAGAGLVAGCGSKNPVNQIENQITCHDVCQRYSDCYDQGYDVSGCTDRCTNDSTAEQQKDDELKTCDDCIGDKSCVSATFNCGSECSPFVP